MCVPLLRSNLRSFPALVNCCYIDWYFPWTNEALGCVAEKVLEDASISVPSSQVPLIVSCCVAIHNSVNTLSAQHAAESGRDVHVTSLLFVRLVNAFMTTMSQVFFFTLCAFVGIG